jgi:hypothetical protein
MLLTLLLTQGTAGQALTTGLFINSGSFFASTVSAGPVTLTVSPVENTSVIYAATVSKGAVSLTPGRYDSASAFYTPTVTTGSVTVTAGLYSNSQTFYPAGLVIGGVPLQPSLYNNANSFLAATGVPGAASLVPPRYDNGREIFLPSVQLSGGPQTLTASLFVNAGQFYVAAISAAPNTYFPPAGGIGSKPIRPQDYQPMFTGRSRRRRQEDIVFLGG